MTSKVARLKMAVAYERALESLRQESKLRTEKPKKRKEKKR